jgi:hypothetical protein
MGVDKTLQNEFEANTTGPRGWPRLVSGEAYLTQTTPAAPGKLSVCIVGGGPTAAWCVERAESLGNTVCWLSADKLNAAFISSRRNDGLLVGPVVRKPVNGNHVISGNLRPSNPSTIFGEGADVDGIAAQASGEVAVSLKTSPAPTPVFTDSRGPMLYAPTLLFDQVVLSIGQETSFKHPESWASILKSVLASAVHAGTHLISDRQGRIVGLHSADDRVRALGATALSHPDVVAEWSKPGTPSNLFYRSLAEQGRVAVGIALAAVTIAEANGFWNSAVNENLNTAGLSDLKQLTAALPVNLDSAETWFTSRGARIPPFELMELQHFAKQKVYY